MTHAKVDQILGARRLVFIGGMHKSGSTLMAATLGSMRSVSALVRTGVPGDEGQYLQNELKPDPYYGEILFGLSDECRLNEGDAESAGQLGKMLLEHWSAHWDLESPVLVEKSPYNLVRTRFLQSLFPKARFVMMIRDPRTSYMAARKALGRVSCADYVRNWIGGYGTLFMDRSHLRNCIDVPYEGFIARPNETVAVVLEFLGLESPLPRVAIDPSADKEYRVRWNTFLESEPSVRSKLPDLPIWSHRYGYSLEPYCQDQ